MKIKFYLDIKISLAETCLETNKNIIDFLEFEKSLSRKDKDKLYKPESWANFRKELLG